MIFKALKDAEKSLDVLLEFSRLNTDENNFKEIAISSLMDNAIKLVQFQINETNAMVEIQSLPESMKG